MTEYIKYIFAVIGICAFFYFLSRIQMTAWIHSIEQFFNQKIKENEQKKKK